MKKNFILLAIAYIILANSNLLAQGPPPPPGNPEIGGGPIGGPAPLESGAFLLLAFGGLYAGYKIRKASWDRDD
jgi:hypothetical protein